MTFVCILNVVGNENETINNEMYLTYVDTICYLVNL